MRHIIAAAAIALAGSAYTLSAVAEPTMAPREALAKALECSEANKELEASFTLNFRQLGSTWITHRYDASTKEWTFLSGSLDTLKKRGRQAFERLSQEVGQPGGLVPKDLQDTVSDLEYLSEESGAYLYSFTPIDRKGEKPMPEAMVDALVRRFAIDDETLCASALTMQATKPFKAGTMTKVESFAFAYHFEKAGGSQIPLLSGFTSASKGKSFFTSFEEDIEVTITDVVLLDQ